MNRPIVRYLISFVILLLAGCAVIAPAPDASVNTASPATEQPTAALPTQAPPTDVPPTAAPLSFDENLAFQHIEAQLAMGERRLGTPGYEQVIRYIDDTLTQYGWEVTAIQGLVEGQLVQNIFAVRGSAATSRVLLGAHYDTRQYADKDPDPARRSLPVPGANDGASGVAVLLELARVLPETETNVMLAFFDAEDQGDIDGQPWIRGSTYFAETFLGGPNSPQLEAAVIIDMIGDADLQVYYEGNSDPVLQEQIWSIAASLGYSDHFIPEPRFSIIDDHLPFIRAGIPAVDIIDFDFPYHHTIEDTLDKVSAESLAVIGNTLLAWLEQYP